MNTPQIANENKPERRNKPWTDADEANLLAFLCKDGQVLADRSSIARAAIALQRTPGAVRRRLKNIVYRRHLQGVVVGAICQETSLDRLTVVGMICAASKSADARDLRERKQGLCRLLRSSNVSLCSPIELADKFALSVAEVSEVKQKIAAPIEPTKVKKRTAHRLRDIESDVEDVKVHIAEIKQEVVGMRGAFSEMKTMIVELTVLMHSAYEFEDEA
jgi:hypothetical protein